MKDNRITIAFVSVVVVALMGTVVSADVITVSNSASDVADTFIAPAYTWFPAATGTDTELKHLPASWSYATNFLVRFDALPTGISSDDIVSARLGLYRIDSGVGLVASRIAAAAAFAENTTWAGAHADNRRQWTHLTSEDIVGTIGLSAGTGYKWGDVTSIVKSWISGAVINDGLLICNYANGSWAGYPGVRVGSSDNSNAQYRPVLEITTVPEPATMGIVSLGLAGILFRKKQGR